MCNKNFNLLVSALFILSSSVISCSDEVSIPNDNNDPNVVYTNNNDDEISTVSCESNLLNSSNHCLTADEVDEIKNNCSRIVEKNSYLNSTPYVNNNTANMITTFDPREELHSADGKSKATLAELCTNYLNQINSDDTDANNVNDATATNVVDQNGINPYLGQGQNPYHRNGMVRDYRNSNQLSGNPMRPQNTNHRYGMNKRSSDSRWNGQASSDLNSRWSAQEYNNSNGAWDQQEYRNYILSQLFNKAIDWAKEKRAARYNR